MPQDNAIVGIDVSKGKADGCIRSLAATRSAPSSPEGMKEMVSWLRKNNVALAVMEASGGYEQPWAEALRKAHIKVRIVDPKRVRHFAKSAGKLAKNDPIDAEMIAWFAETFPDAPEQPHDPDREALASLVRARKTLIDMKTELGNWGEHSQPRPMQQAQLAVIKSLDGQIGKLEVAMANMIKSRQDFTDRAEIIDSVPGLGAIAVAGVISHLPELGHVSNKVAAALLGAAPYDDDSGKHKGERHIRGGRRDIRNLLYMPVMGAATRHNPVLKGHYDQLRARGKEPKVAFIACMRKLVVILNTMLARGEKWTPEAYAKCAT
jgi:transposase